MLTVDEIAKRLVPPDEEALKETQRLLLGLSQREEFLRMVRTGTFTDGFSVAALLVAALQIGYQLGLEEACQNQLNP